MKIIFYALFALMLTACGTFKNQENQYLQSQTAKPITVSSDLSSSSIENYYPIPNSVKERASKPVSLTPPGMGTKS